MATKNIYTRISEYQIGADGIITAKLFDEDPPLYNPRSIGDPVIRSGYPGQSVSAPGSTILRLLDINTLRDPDDGPGWYATVCGVNTDWTAAVIYRRDDPSANYQNIATMDQLGVIGFTRSVLGFGPSTLWDYVNTVDVEIIGAGVLASVSEDEALLGTVGYLIGDEIVLCQNVTQLTAKTWRLNGPLARGWCGTEHARGTHVNGERFIVLSTTTIRRMIDLLSEIGMERTFKAVTAGLAIEDAIGQAFTDTGVSLKPWSPIVDRLVTVDGSNNMTINSNRRSRLRGRNGFDFFDPPLGEATESYELDVYTDDWVTLKRTITSLTGAFAYSAANQTTDFGVAPKTGLRVKEYQISADVGRGYPAYQVVNVEVPLVLSAGAYAVSNGTKTLVVHDMSQGAAFIPSVDAILVDADFYWPTVSAKTVRVYVEIINQGSGNAETRLGSVDVAVSAIGVYVATFATPIYVLKGVKYAVFMYQTDGVNRIDSDVEPATPPYGRGPLLMTNHNIWKSGGGLLGATGLAGQRYVCGPRTVLFES